MATLQHFREGMAHAWESIAEGWQHLYRRAASAITRFVPHREKNGTLTEQGREMAARSSGWGVLATELFDDDNRVTVRIEAPGMELEDFDLEVVDDLLMVRGEKRVSREREEGRYHILECAYGSFERVIPLPAEVEPDKARARYRRGVLQIELPKSSAHRRRTIEVKVG